MLLKAIRSQATCSEPTEQSLQPRQRRLSLMRPSKSCSDRTCGKRLRSNEAAAPDHERTSSCWRLLRLTSQVLDNSTAFENVLWPALNARHMEAIDTAQIPGPDDKDVPLVFDRTNAVRLSAAGAGTTGDLLRVTGDTRQTVQVDL